MTLLSTAGLCKSFGGLDAVVDMSFSVDDGEVRGIIGPNGAGKTTFVSLLSGRLNPSSGTIRFRDRDITRLPAWKRVRLGIAYTFQITSIYPALTVDENVAIGAQLQARISHEPGRSLESRIDSVVGDSLARTGMEGYREHKAGELAYGHQRLLEIAMGLSLHPSLLILDEPTQGLSDREIADFCELIGEIRKSTTIVLIEHNMPVVMSLADRVTVMDQGAVLAEGSPGEIQDNARVQEAYLGG